MELGLSHSEIEALDRATNLLNLDHKTRKLSEFYYFEYKQKARIDFSEKLLLVVNCAIFAASKSQILTTINGETIRGIGISITQIIRSSFNGNVNSEEFLEILKDFISTVNIDAEVSNELKLIIDKFAFSYTFFNKYTNLIRSLDINIKIPTDEDYFKYLSNLGWLFFICAKANLLQNRTELIESVYLLTAILAHILLYKPNYITIGYLDKLNVTISNNHKNEEEFFQQVICELLKINYYQEDIKLHQNAYNEYLQNLIDNDILKVSDKNKFDSIYDIKYVIKSLTKLEQYYLKKLNHDDLDERFYIREKKANAPGKFTPFAKQGAANKNINIQWNLAKNENPQVSKKPYNSHRILNYEVSEIVTLNSNLNEIKFANKVIPPSPYTKLVQATPMTAALEMYNWMTEKTKIRRLLSGLPPFMDQLCLTISEKFRDDVVNKCERLIEKVLINESQKDDSTTTTLIFQKKLKDKTNQILCLYYKAIEEYLMMEDKKENNENYRDILRDDIFNRAMIANAIETVFFINNSSNITFIKLMELCDIQPYQFWTVIPIFLKSDQNIPYPVKKHFHEIEIKIIINLAWKKGSIVHEFIKDLARDAKNIHMDSEIQRLSRKVDLVDNSHLSRSEAASDIDFSKFLSNSLNNQVMDSKSISTTSFLFETKLHIDGPKKDIKYSKLITDIFNSQDLFFKRILHHCALEIYQLCEQLCLNEQVSENVWTVMKYILSTETTILIDRNIIQIILCTVYGVCKIMRHSLKFQEIIDKYLEISSLTKNEVYEIYNVNIKDNENIDIIKFYNTVYISQLKNFLFTFINTTNANITNNHNSQEAVDNKINIKKPMIPSLAFTIGSPLKDSLPYYIQNTLSSNNTTNNNNKKKSPMIKMGLTPLTSALYAESPKSFDNIHNPIKSRKILNMDDAEIVQEKIKDKKSINNQDMMEKIIERDVEDYEQYPNIKPSSKKLLFSNQNDAQDASHSINQDDTSTRNISLVNSNSNSNGLFGMNHRINIPNGPKYDINTIANFPYKLNNGKPGTSLFNNIKGGKQLIFEDMGSNSIYNDIKHKECHSIGPKHKLSIDHSTNNPNVNTNPTNQQ